MTAIDLEALPCPPSGRTGWPWTQTSKPLPSTQSDGSPWPRLRIVTPSYNQGQFLEETIRSVLLQSYPNLEYVIIDGGSTDNSLEILERYSPWLDCWVSESDRGQYDALNKGFAKTSGEIMAWINADDRYVANAFAAIGHIFAQFADVHWVASLHLLSLDQHSNETSHWRLPGYSRTGFWRAEHMRGVAPFSSPWIPQEASFWRQALWEQAGGRVDENLDMAGDFDLWMRFYHHAELYGIDTPLAGFRRHPRQKTAQAFQRYAEEARRTFARYGGRPNTSFRAALRRGVTLLPDRLRQPFVRVGLAYPSPIIVPAHGPASWRVVTTAV